MKQHLQHIDKAFENSVRLSIMALLMVNASLDFGSLKKQLDLTDGNLASNLSYLQDCKYISVKKQFINNKPNSSYLALPNGRKAFRAHIDAMEKIISASKK